MTLSTRITSISVHLPDVDDALPRLLEHLEQLQVSVLNNEDWPHLEARFKLVGALAIRAFRREEEAMSLCRDRGALLHKSAHQKFLKTFASIRSACAEQGPSVALAQDLRRECIDWFHDHHRLMNANLGRVVKDMVERSKAWHESTNVAPGSSGFQA